MIAIFARSASQVADLWYRRDYFQQKEKATAVALLFSNFHQLVWFYQFIQPTTAPVLQDP